MEFGAQRTSLIRFPAAPCDWLRDAYDLVYGLRNHHVDTDSDDPGPHRSPLLETYFHSYSRRGGRSFTVELVSPNRRPEDLLYVDAALIENTSDTTWLLYVETAGVSELHDWIASRMRGEIMDVRDGRIVFPGTWAPPVRDVVVPAPPWPEEPESRGFFRRSFEGG